MSVPPLYTVVGFVALERCVEVIYAERNAHALRRRGAHEFARVQYPFFVALHLAWLLSMLLFIPASVSANWILIGAYAVLQILRFWILASLGERFTTRVIVLAGSPLVRSGPYRFMRHPNYVVVVLEIALLPCAFGAYSIAALFSVLNAVLLWWRVRAEDHALSTYSRFPVAGS